MLDAHQESGCDEADKCVEDSEGNEDAEIAPASVEGDAEGAVEFVAGGKLRTSVSSMPAKGRKRTNLAVLARRREVAILKVAACDSDEIACPLLASLSEGRLEGGKLALEALDRELVCR